MSGHDPQVITLVYDAEVNRCRVDIGNIDPTIAAKWLYEAADDVEGLALRPTYVVVIDGVEQTMTYEPEED